MTQRFPKPVSGKTLRQERFPRLSRQSGRCWLGRLRAARERGKRPGTSCRGDLLSLVSLLVPQACGRRQPGTTVPPAKPGCPSLSTQGRLVEESEPGQGEKRQGKTHTSVGRREASGHPLRTPPATLRSGHHGGAVRGRPGERGALGGTRCQGEAGLCHLLPGGPCRVAG